MQASSLFLVISKMPKVKTNLKSVRDITILQTLKIVHHITTLIMLNFWESYNIHEIKYGLLHRYYKAYYKLLA